MSSTTNSNVVEYTGVKRESVFLKRVYLWMVSGLLTTALVAYGVSFIPGLVNLILRNPFILIGVSMAELVVVFILSLRIERMKSATAIVCFFLYAALTGVTFSMILVAYAGTTIVPKAFLSAASIFVVASIYGGITKRPVEKWYNWIFIGLFGLLIATSINLLFGWNWLDLAASAVGVVVFTALTIVDTKKVVSLNASYGDMMLKSELTKISILGAFDIYLDFLNIFLYILRFFARSNDNN